mgnify:CR=1 FL=1
MSVATRRCPTLARSFSDDLGCRQNTIGTMAAVWVKCWLSTTAALVLSQRAPERIDSVHPAPRPAGRTYRRGPKRLSCRLVEHEVLTFEVL